MPLAWNSDNSSIPYSSASRARSVAKRQSATSSSLRNTPALIVVLLTSSARSTGARRLRRGSRKRQAWRERPVDSRAAPGSTPGHRIQGAKHERGGLVLHRGRVAAGTGHQGGPVVAAAAPAARDARL